MSDFLAKLGSPDTWKDTIIFKPFFLIQRIKIIQKIIVNEN